MQELSLLKDDIGCCQGWIEATGAKHCVQVGYTTEDHCDGKCLEEMVIGKRSLLVLDANEADSKENSGNQQSPECLPVASPSIICITVIIA